jgi:hypothetical protein
MKWLTDQDAKRYRLPTGVRWVGPYIDTWPPVTDEQWAYVADLLHRERGEAPG